VKASILITENFSEAVRITCIYSNSNNSTKIYKVLVFSLGPQSEAHYYQLLLFQLLMQSKQCMLLNARLCGIIVWNSVFFVSYIIRNVVSFRIIVISDYIDSDNSKSSSLLLTVSVESGVWQFVQG